MLVPTVVTKYASEVDGWIKDLPCLPQSFSLLWHGGMVHHLPLQRPRKEEGEGEKPVVTCPLSLPLLFHLGPQPVGWCGPHPGQISGETPSQTHPEVCAANLLGVSQLSHAASC